MSTLIYLSGEKLSVQYDTERKVLHVIYRGILSPQVTSDYYQWLIPNMKANPHLVTSTRGSIYDFSEVTEFIASNLIVANRESQSASQNEGIQSHPVALIVQTQAQEEHLRISLQIGKDSKRKKIVYSLHEAFDFIEQWHNVIAE